MPHITKFLLLLLLLLLLRQEEAALVVQFFITMSLNPGRAAQIPKLSTSPAAPASRLLHLWRTTQVRVWIIIIIIMCSNTCLRPTTTWPMTSCCGWRRGFPWDPEELLPSSTPLVELHSCSSLEDRCHLLVFGSGTSLDTRDCIPSTSMRIPPMSPTTFHYLLLSTAASSAARYVWVQNPEAPYSYSSPFLVGCCRGFWWALGLQEVRWARISMYNAERRLLGNALLDYSNEWFVLLSEACIPLDNFRNTYEYITSSRLNFVQSNLEEDDSSAAALVVKEGSSAGGGGSRLSREQEQEMGPEITRQNFRKGSQWFQINRELAMLLAADTKLYDKFALSFCNPSPRACYMDEHYLPTVAALWLPEKLAYRTLTYFHFRGHAPHPDHWDKTRVNKNLIQRLRRGGDGRNYTTSIGINGLQPSQNKSSSVCYFFARKFDADALELLLDIATEVMGIQALDWQAH